MRLRHIIIYFSLIILSTHIKIPSGYRVDLPVIGHIGLAHARGGDNGGHGGGGDDGGNSGSGGGSGGGHGGDSGSGGGSGSGGNDGGSGSGGSGDGGHGGDSGSGGNSGGGSGDGGHGGDSGSGGDSGDDGDGGDSGTGGGDDGDGGHDGDGDDSNHDASHDTDHDDAAHAHDTTHTAQDHPDTVDSTHHDDDHIDHHDEISHTVTPQPPPAVADHSITSPAEAGDGKLFEPGILLAVNAEPSDREAAWAMGLAVEEEVSLEHLGIVVTRFRLPRGANIFNSLHRLLQQKSDAPYDLNHYYQTAAATEGKDARTYPRRMIGWPSLPSNASDPVARIGMVDTLVNARIAALRQQQIIIRSFATGKKKSPSTHGTRIASIIVGSPGSKFPGLMPAARLYATNAFSTDKAGRHHAPALAIAQALDWLAGQSVDVINLSLAGPDNRLLRLAVRHTLEKPIPIVAAAGNRGPKALPAFPAAYKDVIAVTAVDRFNRIYRHANQGAYIRFSAPGVRIWVPGKTAQGDFRQGTSYATAFGTAMATRYWNRPGMVKSIAALVQSLRKDVIDLGPPGKDPIFGWGLIHYATPTR